MADKGKGFYRSVYSVLFDDPDYQKLAPNARLVFNTLKGASWNNITGIYQFDCGSLLTLHKRTGLSGGEMVRALDELEREKWIVYQYPVLWVRNSLKFEPHINLNDEKHLKAINIILKSLPKIEIVANFCNYYGLKIPSGYPSKSINIPTTYKFESLLEALVVTDPNNPLNRSTEAPTDAPKQDPSKAPCVDPCEGSTEDPRLAQKQKQIQIHINKSQPEKTIHNQEEPDLPEAEEEGKTAQSAGSDLNKNNTRIKEDETGDIPKPAKKEFYKYWAGEFVKQQDISFNRQVLATDQFWHLAKIAGKVGNENKLPEPWTIIAMLKDDRIINANDPYAFVLSIFTNKNKADLLEYFQKEGNNIPFPPVIAQLLEGKVKKVNQDTSSG